MLNVFESLDARSLFAAGAIDTTFADHGAARLDFYVPHGMRAAAAQAVVDSAGRTYVVAGLHFEAEGEQAFQIMRLTADGTPDTAWAVGHHGRLRFDWSKHPFDSGNPFTSDTWEADGFRVAVDSADRLIVLEGTTLRRYASDGRSDRGFGDHGSVALDGFRSVADVAVDAADRVLVTGTVPRGHLPRMAVARLTAGGVFDPKFGHSGVFAAPAFGGVADPKPREDGVQIPRSYGRFLRVLDDGSILVAGEGIETLRTTDPTSIYNNYEVDGVQAVRLTARGRPDRGYGTRGVAESFGFTGMASYDTIYSGVIGIRPDGAVVMESFTSLFDGDGDVVEETNNLLSADKSGAVTDDRLLDLTPQSASSDSAVGRVTFVGRAGGPYVTLSGFGVDGNRLFRQSARGKFDSTFETDARLPVPDAIAAGPHGTVTTAGAGALPDEVVVRRLSLG